MRQFTGLAMVCWLLAVGMARTEEPAPKLKQVMLEVVLAEFDASAFTQEQKDPKAAGALLKALEQNPGKLYSYTQVRLLTHEGVQSSAQFGEQPALVTSRTLVSGGGEQRGFGVAPRTGAYIRQSVGTLVSATTRVDGEQIILELTLEQSRMVADPKADAEAQQAGANYKPITRSYKTTITLGDGQTALVGSMQSAVNQSRRQEVALISAHLQ